MVGEVNSILVLKGSSRNDGHTNEIVTKLISMTDWDFIDLNDYTISYYDYEQKNRNDDFLPLMNSIINKYKVIVFVTPVYWYSMSGIMKVFFDRITDILDGREENRFKNMNMCVVSSSAGDNLGEDFWIPFKKTAEYLGMNYLADLHSIDNQIDEKKVQQFIQKIKVELC